MLSGNTTLADLRARFTEPGRLEWVGLRPARRAPMLEPDSALLVARHGIEGDRAAARAGRQRQVTLIQHEHLAVIAALTGHSVVPADLRRNLSVSGLNVLALREHRFRIGHTVLEGTGLCHPCSRMEQTLGHGGYNTMRGHGGITAIVIESGAIALGDALTIER